MNIIYIVKPYISGRGFVIAICTTRERAEKLAQEYFDVYDHIEVELGYLNSKDYELDESDLTQEGDN